MTSTRWWALGALVLSVLALGLDVTVLNVALPTLAADLGASTGDLQWIAAAYMVPFAALMLPAGAAGDRFGRKRVLLLGLTAFGAASVVAMLAHDTGQLIAARALMGAGGAVIMPLATSILRVIFPEGERGRAIAIFTGALALGLPLGPIIGGYLLDHYQWGSIFAINLPVVALALVAGAVLIPESRDESAPRLDLIGALLSVSGLATLTYGIIQAPVDGWAHPAVLIGLGLGAALLALFVLVESRVRPAMVDLGLFRNRIFLWGAIGATFVNLGMTGVLFVVPLHLQAVQGYDAFGTGLRIIPMVAGLMAGGLSSERLTRRAGLRVAMTTGLLVLALGFGLGSLTSLSSGYGYIAAWLAVVGAGTGLAMVPATDGVLSMLPEHRTGSGSATLQTMRQVGGAFGVAVLGSLLSAVYVSGLPAAAPQAAKDSILGAASVGDPALLRQAYGAFAGGMDVVLLVCCGLALLAAALMMIFLPRGTALPEAAQSDHELTSAGHRGPARAQEGQDPADDPAGGPAAVHGAGL